MSILDDIEAMKKKFCEATGAKPGDLVLHIPAGVWERMTPKQRRAAKNAMRRK